MIDNKKLIDIDNEDFGFSLISEADLKAQEQALQKQIEKSVALTANVKSESQDKLHKLRDMIMPLLNNLAKDPDKEFIKWKDRSAKMNKFIKKINDFVDGSQ